MDVTRGSATSSTITLTSIGEFAGTVDLTMSISPSNAGSPTLRLNPNRITLLSGGTGNAVLTINTIGTTRLGTYTIVVLGVTGTLANSVSINLIVRWKLRPSSSIGMTHASFCISFDAQHQSFVRAQPAQTRHQTRGHEIQCFCLATVAGATCFRK